MNLSFLKLDVNFMDDAKIKLIRKMPEGDSIIVLWLGLMCLAMKSGRPGVAQIGDGIPFNEETLASVFDMNINIVRLGLEIFARYRMVEIWEDGEVFLINFEKHQNLEKIEKAREISRESSKKYREKVKGLISDGHVTVSDETEKNKNKNKNKNRSGKTTKFIPPTVEEVKIYCQERNNGINPEKFVSYYEAAKWFRGKTKIKDWKACVRTWENNSKDKGIKHNGFTKEYYEQGKKRFPEPSF